MNEPAESIPIKLAQFELAEYVDQIRGRVLEVTGTFDHKAETLIGPRSAPAGLVGTAAQGLAINPQGYYVVTPLERSDGTVVFVNRGWVEKSQTEWFRPPGVVSVTTVVSSGEKVSTFSPQNDPTKKRLFWLEEDALRKCTNRSHLSPKEVIVLEAFEPDNVPVTSYPAARRQKHLTEQHVTPLMHLVYAFTWFSLSAAGFMMTFSKFRKPVGRRGSKVGTTGTGDGTAPKL
jgi:surfeit locus 1 family protein